MNKRVGITLAVVAFLGILGLSWSVERPSSGGDIALPVIKDVVGLRLDEAKDVLAGISVDEEDYLGEDSVWRDKNWTVCTQSVNPGERASSVMLKVAKYEGDCPDQRTPEERAVDNAKAEQEANEQAKLEEYYAGLEAHLTSNEAVLKPGEWATIDQCEVRLTNDPEPMVTTFENTYEDLSWLLNSKWAINELGDYLYAYFETKPGCGHFAPSAVTLEKGYDHFWGKEHSVAWTNTYVPEGGGEGAIVIYKVKDGATKFKLGLNYGAGPSYEISVR